MKKRILSILAVLAVAVNMVGCTPPNAVPSEDLNAGVQSETTVTETTTVQTEEQNVYETLAEGQERDWKIEDVLKNDLSIDGIPISIPCTVGELLDTLGNDYDIDDELDKITYKGGKTDIGIHFTKDSNEADRQNCIINSISWYNILKNDNGVLLTKAHKSNPEEFLKLYPEPNSIKYDDEWIHYRYLQNGYYFVYSFNDGAVHTIRIGLNEEAVK